MVKPNEQIGPYVLIRQLGKGGFGVVWLAQRRSQLATTEVALKLILDSDPDIDAITKESQLWVQAGGHPNVLSIIEANMYDNQVVIASEYAPDGSLQEWIKHKEQVSLLEVINLTIGILSGLEHLHSRRIIHRDLKPANILLSKGIPRLADFGLARVMKSSANSGSVAGTPAYMAPEAFDGKRSLQSDIWSVGVILYQLLCNRLPFPQSDIAALIGAIVGRNPQLMDENIPVSLQKIVFRALQKNASQRYESATEMKLDLQNALKSLEINDIRLLEKPIKQFSDIAFVTTKQLITEQVLVNETARNNTGIDNSQKSIPVSNISNSKVVPKTTKVLPSKLSSMDLPKEQNNKWKTYTIVILCALILPIGSLAYFKSQENQNLLSQKSSFTDKISPKIELKEIPDKQSQEITQLNSPNPSKTNSLNPEEVDLDKLKNSTNPIDYENFIRKYPNSKSVPFIEKALKALQERKNIPSTNNEVSQTEINKTEEKKTSSTPSSLGSSGVMRASNGNESEFIGTNIRSESNTESPYELRPRLQDNKRPIFPPENNLEFINITGVWRQRGGFCNDSMFKFTQNGDLVSVEGNERCGSMNGSMQRLNVRMNREVLEYNTRILDKNVHVAIFFSPDGMHAKKYCQIIGENGRDISDLEKQ